MDVQIFDSNVSTTMNIFLVIANILNIVYNVPQMYRTYKRKTTGDISSWFLSLRIVSNVIWVAYSIEINSLLMLINNCVTVFSSLFIGYYKVLELRRDKTSSETLLDSL